MADKREKDKRRSSRRLKKAFKFLVISGVILGILVYSPLFSVREIKVTGNSNLSEKEVAEISGVALNASLFNLDTVAVTKRMMEDLRIEEVTVRRHLPSTLAIHIKERKPLLTVEADYGYFDIDRRGMVIDNYLTLKKMNTPMLTGIILHNMYIGDETQDPTIKKILEYLQYLDAESLNRISEIAVVSSDYVVAYTTKSVQIRLGKLERLEEKARLTADFLQDLEENKRPVEFIDFNYTAPFVKMAQ